jgi:hypothetical protein
MPTTTPAPPAIVAPPYAVAYLERGRSRTLLSRRHCSFASDSAYRLMKIFGRHDEKTIQQFQHVREGAVDAALMADGHVGYVMPIGGVAAYRETIYGSTIRTRPIPGSSTGLAFSSARSIS